MVFMTYSLRGNNNTCNAFIAKIREIVFIVRIQSLLAEKMGFADESLTEAKRR